MMFWVSPLIVTFLSESAKYTRIYFFFFYYNKQYIKKKRKVLRTQFGSWCNSWFVYNELGQSGILNFICQSSVWIDEFIYRFHWYPNFFSFNNRYCLDNFFNLLYGWLDVVGFSGDDAHAIVDAVIIFFFKFDLGICNFFYIIDDFTTTSYNCWYKLRWNFVFYDFLISFFLVDILLWSKYQFYYYFFNYKRSILFIKTYLFVEKIKNYNSSSR